MVFILLVTNQLAALAFISFLSFFFEKFAILFLLFYLEGIKIITTAPFMQISIKNVVCLIGKKAKTLKI